MPAWLPVLKASLPYITQIVSAAIPAFTAKPAQDDAAELVPKQIAELQTAVTHNAEAVKGIASQLKDTIEGITAGANKLEQEILKLKRIAAFALLLALGSMALAIWALIGTT